VCRATRVGQRDAGTRDPGSRFQQLRVGHPRDQGIFGPWGGALADQLPERAPEARLADGGSTLGTLGAARGSAVGQEQGIPPIHLCQQASHEARRLGIGGHAVLNPLSLTIPLDEPGLRKDLQVPRHARLTLPQRLGELGNAQRSLRTQREESEATAFARGPEPADHG